MYLPQVVVGIVLFLNLLALHAIDEHGRVVVKPVHQYSDDDLMMVVVMMVVVVVMMILMRIERSMVGRNETNQV